MLKRGIWWAVISVMVGSLFGCDWLLKPEHDECPSGFSDSECMEHFNSLLDGGSTGGEVDAGCTSNTMCTAAVASKCDSGECVACVADSDCSHIDGKSRCDEGRCEVCTPDTEMEDCDGKSCHPETKVCTTTTLNSVGTCGECVSDSECLSNATTERRCVMTRFGSPLADHGMFCLVKKAEVVSCPKQTIVEIDGSSAGGESATYCYPSQGLTTCEAIEAFGDGCSVDADCGVTNLDDGLCKNNNGSGLKCTYKCGGDINECKEGFSCYDDISGMQEYCCTASGGCT